MKTFFKRLTILLFIVTSCTLVQAQNVAGSKVSAQKPTANTTVSASDSAVVDDAELDSVTAEKMSSATTLASDDSQIEQEETPSFHKALKTKFIEGNAGFMSFVALALVLGLAFYQTSMVICATDLTPCK